ncbi:hypothetical protein DYBT9275_04128 [Dyadobacter sp. CECT 9275]|uniref:Uncharacterized protein n=1 Tax=Dyadobacter helix TaxID=2822344 RepID=A0A916JEP5_9BACT|nr:hypothetical protein DYBT9275_04128 [Dyadobacter sp. CECT 9275]
MDTTGDLIGASVCMRVKKVRNWNLKLTEISTIRVLERDFDKYPLEKLLQRHQL